MQINDRIHGFRVLERRDLGEISAVLWRMEYEKNGARLIWLDRPDDNMTFSIAFKTIPQDDTGVFHILEHSVLNGSEKYPVKEPFVELLKSSMATFLNAMTFPDKTMYPVSSRNRQDFLNLMDVYLDAVLHPVSLRDRHAFLQEGWHYELDSPEGELRCNGVVYNEMKGAYSSADTVMEEQMDRLLFPSNCYSKSSGGDPEHIPELTYENYLASHRRFYHPSNAYIVLDGQVDLDAALEKLDGFLREYERIDPDADIPMQEPVAPAEKTVSYEIGPEEDETSKAILAGGWVFGKFDDMEKNIAFSVLSRLLCGSNDSPLTKALLDAGLCEDVSLEKLDGVQQLYAILQIKNVDPAKKDEIWALVEKVLRQQCEQGLDKKRLHSIFNRMEFITREKDYGSMPRGLVYAIAAMEGWLYGGDPAMSLAYDAVFASLRKKADEGWFEAFLAEALLDNPHRARLVMLPSKTLGREKAEAEAARCAAVKAGWDRAQTEKVIADFAALRARQSQADTPETLRCLPTLSLADIPEKGMPVRQDIAGVQGVTLLHQPVETDGIVYLDMYFALDDLSVRQLQQVKLLTKLLGQVATERYDALALRSELEGSLGRFSASMKIAAAPGQTERATPWLSVGLSLLPDHKADAVRLLDEILNRSKFDDTPFIYNILRQVRLDMEQSITAGGNAFGAMRVSAQCSAWGLLGEATHGISMLRALQAWDKDFEGQGAALCGDLAALCGRIFSKKRLAVSLTGERDDAFVADALAVLSDGPMGEPAVYEPLPAKKEGFVIPAGIGFAVTGANLNDLGASFSGTATVAGQLLTFDYLWNEVRVKGGAYGVNLAVRPMGDVGFSSYRDPSPAKTLDTFAGAGQALRDVCAGGDIDKYIISTVASTEPVMSPWTEGMRAVNLWLNGQSEADLDRQRLEILRTTPESLSAFGKVLEDVCAAGHVCVIGGKDALDACQGLDSVESIQ